MNRSPVDREMRRHLRVGQLWRSNANGAVRAVYRIDSRARLVELGLPHEYRSTGDVSFEQLRRDFKPVAIGKPRIVP